jgi:hypothetical protein
MFGGGNRNEKEGKLVLLPYSSGANRIKPSTTTATTAAVGNSQDCSSHHVSVVCIRGGNSNDGSWSPVENIACPDLVNSNQDRSSNQCNNQNSIIINGQRQQGVQRKQKTNNRGRGRRRLPLKSTEQAAINYAAFQGLVAEAVVGTTDAGGQVLHLVKWEGMDELQFVPAIFTTIKFPHIVLAFYQNRIRFSCSSSSNTNNSNDD